MAWANIFSRILFPSQHFPFFLLLVTLLCPSVSFFPSQPAVFGKDLVFPRCAQVGICSWSPLSVTESNLLNEIIYVPTLCTRQTREHYLSSLFIPEEPRLKLLFCEMEHSHSRGSEGCDTLYPPLSGLNGARELSLEKRQLSPMRLRT